MVYNQAFNVEDNDWVCLIDYDVMFLTHRSIPLMYRYVDAFPEAGMFVCFTNRIHPLAKDQLFLGKPSDDMDVKFWQIIASVQELEPLKVTEIKHEVSGFLMLISKRVWQGLLFSETGKSLGVDNDFSLRLLASGKKIYRMDTLVVWHSYRMKDIRDKSHLL